MGELRRSDWGSEMNALDKRKERLSQIQAAQRECLTDYGHVKTNCRYKYQILLDDEVRLKSIIAFYEILQSQESVK